MNILKNKLLWIAPIAVLIILALFALAFYPAFNPKPKEIPIAVVNNDQGTDIQDNHLNIGKKISDNLLDSDTDTVAWKQVDSESAARKGIEDGKYFGVAIFDKNFSKDAMSQTQKVIIDAKKEEMKDKVKSGEIPPAQAKQMQQKMAQSGADSDIDVTQAKLKTIVNSGASMQAAQVSTNVLSGMSDRINDQITKQSIETLEKQDVKVDASDINGINTPVKADNEKIHEVKDHQAGGNAPFLMFMPVWIGSIVVSVLLLYAFRSSNNFTRPQRLTAAGIQMAIAVVTSFVGAFSYVHFMGGVLGFHFDEPNKIALFIAIAMIGFIGLILGTMTWIGLPAIPIFLIAMFFSMQLVTYPKEMLPDFYQKYIVGWNPFTHYANSLRELIYMNHSIQLDSTMWMFIGFMIFGVIAIVTASLIRKHSDKSYQVPS